MPHQALAWALRLSSQEDISEFVLVNIFCSHTPKGSAPFPLATKGINGFHRGLAPLRATRISPGGGAWVKLDGADTPVRVHTSTPDNHHQDPLHTPTPTPGD